MAPFPSRSALVTGLLWALMAVSSIVQFEPAPFDLMAVALCGFFFVLGLRIPRGLAPPLLAAGVFLLANALSIAFAPPIFAEHVPYMTFYAGLTVYMFVLMVFFASLVAADPLYMQRVLWHGWLVAAVLAVTLALAAYFRLIPGAEQFLMAGRAKAAFKDANVYGPFLVPVTLYLLARMQGGQIVGNGVRLALFLYLTVGILIGFSRGAWGNFLASLLAFGVLTFLNARTLRNYAAFLSAGSAVIAVTVVLVIVAVSVPEVGEMFERRASLLQRYDVAEGGRFSTQAAALVVIAQNPIGLGPNRTKPFLKRNPHNVYLKIFAENGWLGGVAFLSFIGLTLWRGFFFALQPGPLQTHFSVAYASTLGIVAESFVIDTLHWRHFFVLLAMVWGAMLTSRETRVAPI